ncbi:MAG: DUF58 domain-containing protein [Chloroflexota bacterium]
MPTLAQSPERILQRLDWTVIRRLDGILQGDYRTLFRGFGLDLAELREYQFTDDVRYIDWNVTARMQTPYVRQYTEDREVTAWFLLDVSPSIDFGTTNTLKRNLLIDFTTVLASLLTQHGNRIGAIFYNGKINGFVPPQSGKRQVLYLINELLNQPRLKRSPPTNLAVLLEAAIRIIRKRSLVFIISDFISEPGWDRLLSILSRRHETLAIQLYDPRELELPDIGPIILEDAENGEQIYVDTHDKRFRDRFFDAAARHSHELQMLFQSLGIDVLKLSTDGDLVREIIRFAKIRKQRKLSPVSSVKSNASLLTIGGR